MRKAFAPIALLLLVFMSAADSSGGQPPKTNEIHVTLFGQPCVLTGPMEESQLKQIHSVSPEQVYPQFTAEDSPANTRDQLRKAQSRLQSITGIPSAFEHYREKLGKRIGAQISFFDALASYKKTRKSKVLMDAATKHFGGKSTKTFESAVKKFETQPASSRKLDVEPLLESFNEGIETDPEEEFHRAVRQLNLSYSCAFDPAEESGDEEEE